MSSPGDAGDLAALLARAVDEGVVTSGQAEALKRLSRTAAETMPHDDERLRFITGFADIFVTLGLALFLGALAWLLFQALPRAAALAIVAVASWLLAEVFTRRRRMALPSIALLASFLAAAGAAIEVAAAEHLGAAPMLRLLPWDTDPASVSVAALGTAVLAAVHYWRFRVPVTVAAGVGASFAAALFLLDTLVPGTVAAHANLLLTLCGLLAFGLAMAFDLSDRHRATRASDIAFWLHLLAAPLIVHPLLGLLGARDPSPGAAGAVLAAILLLAAVALLTDRRALLVSGLLYAGIALGRLVRESEFAGQSWPLALLVLGAFVLALSAGWHPLRRALLSLLPAPAAARLPLPMDLR